MMTPVTLPLAGSHRQRVGGLHKAKDGPGEGLAGDDELVVQAGAGLLQPGVPALGAFQGRGLDPVGAVGRDDEHVVAQRADVGDDDMPLASLTHSPPVPGIGIGLPSASNRMSPLPSLSILGAQRVAKEVGRDLAGDVVECGPRNPARPCSAGASNWPLVIDLSSKTLMTISAGGRGRGWTGNLDQAGLFQRHGKVLAVDLVAVGQDRDEVLARRQVDAHRLVQVVLVALGVDRRPAGNGAHARPVAARRGREGCGSVLVGGSV